MLVRGRSPGLAKFGRPRLARVHPRERLYRRLDEGLEHPAVWVSGPPGAGKTALIASYLEARKLRALWYQVDGGDTDPVVCCHFLEVAARRLAPQPGSELLLLGPVQVPDLASYLRHFFSAFYDGLSTLQILVMDNTQEALSSAEFRQLLRTAIREAPEHIRLLIASRTRPPSDFSRLRVSDGLAAIDPNELLFAEDESFLVQRLIAPEGRCRSIEQMRKVHRLTGGWPAGLKLLSQIEDPDTLSVPNGAVASHTAVFDYLAAEVFDRQSEGVRGFLLRVAHLPRMSPAMAVSLGNNGDAIRILEAMHSDSIFTAVHGGRDPHYEFHPLLRQFLLRRARLDLPADEYQRLERQAATLLASAGDVDAAARLLIAGGHWDDLQRLIFEQAASLLARGWQRTLSAWLNALPEGRVATDPWLAYWRGATLLPFDPPSGEAWFADAYLLFRAHGVREGSFLAWAAIVDLICLEWADFSKLDYWLDEATSLRSEFGEPTASLSGRFTASMFGALLFRRPQNPAIHAWADRLLSVIESCHDPNDRILLGCNLQLYYTVGIGQNDQIDRLMTAIEPSADTDLGPFSGTLLWAIRSMQHWSHGEMQQAAAAAEKGSSLANANGLRMWDFLLGALQAYAWLNNGELGNGRAVLARLAKCLDPRRKIDVAHYHYLVCLADLLAEQGAPALRHIEIANAIVRKYGGPQQHALGSLAQAQALHAVGRAEEAREALAHGRQIGLSMRSGILCFQADVCEALFALEEADEERCASALQSAFAIGASQDYVNHNTFRPAVMARLCAFALAHGIEPDYSRRLIRLRYLKAPGVAVDCWPWPVKIYTLGRFSLVVDGKAVAAAGQKQGKPIELLQTLIAFGGRQIAIPRLIESLWSDAECRGGRGAFDANLLRLRRLLGSEDSVLTDGGRVSLNEALCWVDLWQFERLLGRTEQSLGRAGQAAVADQLAQTETLLRLYHGDFLEREDCRPWILSRRERLRNRLGTLLAHVGSGLEAGQQWDLAIRLYQRAIEIEPLAEPCYRRLMVCLRQSGEMAEALRVYGRCCEVLMAGLGATPSSQTEAVRQTLDTSLPPSSLANT
jgi:LuxR family maltose regulon positive regulatory protein